MWFGETRSSIGGEPKKKKQQTSRNTSLVDALSKYVLQTDRRRIKRLAAVSFRHLDRVSSAY